MIFLVNPRRKRGRTRAQATRAARSFQKKNVKLWKARAAAGLPGAPKKYYKSPAAYDAAWGKNPGGRSERKAWGSVARISRQMRSQLARGIHRNPRRRRPVSAAQLRARRAFAAAARSGRLKKGIRLSPVRARRARAHVNARRHKGAEMAARRKKRRRHRINPHRRRRHRVRHTSARRAHHARVNPRRRRRRVRVNARRRHHARYRRNVPSVRGMFGQVVEAGKKTAVILIAKAATNKVASMVPGGGTSIAVITAKQVGIGLVLSMIARRVAPRFAQEVLIGALLAPMEGLLKKVPVIGPALSGYGMLTTSSGVGRWLQPVGTMAGMGRYLEPGSRRGLSSYMDVRSVNKGAYYD